MLEIYKHIPLTQSGSTRVINVVASQAPVIEVQLLEVLIDSFEYDALSYTWEAQKPDMYVLCGGKQLPVTRNCEAALRNISQGRRKRGSFYIWIDAICINQRDVDERNQQVGIMGDIYKWADVVHIWLGEGSPYSKLIFKYQRRHRFVKRWSPKMASWYAKKCGDTLRREERAHLVSALAHHSWFYRAWTIQELANATLPLAWCGKKHASFDELSIFLVILSIRCGPIANYKELTDQLLGHIEVRWELLRIRSDLVGTQIFSIVKLMTRARICSATEPKDKVFALQGVLSELGVKLPIPDYTKSLGLIYSETTKKLIERESSLRILMLVSGIPNPALEAPSWVPDFSDNLPPYDVEESFGDVMTNTTMGSVSAYRFDDTGKLLVRGRVIDKVEWSSSLQVWFPDHNPGPNEHIVEIFDNSDPSSQTKTIQALQDWAVKARGLDPYKPTSQVWAEALTSVLLRESESSNLTKILAAVFTSMILLNMTDIETDFAFSENEIFDSSPNAWPEGFLLLLMRSRRNTFFTTENGYMGTGSLSIKREDLVVLVPGLPTPMVMRAVGDYHRLVAPAWVHGIMDGKYWEQICASNSEGEGDGLEEFTLI